MASGSCLRLLSYTSLVTWNCANGSSITSHSFYEASDSFFVPMLFFSSRTTFS